MTVKLEKLKKFDNEKLTYIVKNYKQYGYDTEIRPAAIDILTGRGINEEDLKLTGNYENVEFNSAKELLAKYSKNSKLAFFFYGLFIITNILALVFLITLGVVGSILTIISSISVISFLISLIVSLLNQNVFLKQLERKMLLVTNWFIYLLKCPLTSLFISIIETK